MICKQNIEEIPKIFRFCRENNIVPKIEPLTLKGRAVKNNIVPNKKIVGNLAKQLLKIDENKYNYSWRLGSAHLASFSKYYERSCFVDSNGFVFPSTATEKFAGNVFKTSLKKIVQSDLFSKLKKTDKHFVKVF